MIRIFEISKEFGTQKAVDRVSIEISKGETLVLLGTSGCGKTTTLKMINRLVEPTSGTIHIANEDIRDKDPQDLRRSIGYVIQNIGLFPHYTVEQNIAIVPRLLKWDEKSTRYRTEKLLHMVGLPEDEFKGRYPAELSGGQQQRVGLARALAADPPVVLMDEPFGALDPITRDNLREEFKQLSTFRDKTVILVSHDVVEAFELADRICLMDKGAIQQTGTAREMLFEPVNDFVRGFFDAGRFQLELKVITLGEIARRLSGDIPAKKDISVDEKIDCAELLKLAMKLNNPNPVVEIVDSESGQPFRCASMEQILGLLPRVKSETGGRG